MNNLEYINNKVITTIKPSKYGIGVFALKDIKPGELLQDRKEALLTLKREELSKINQNVLNIILDRNILSWQDKELTFYNPNVSFDLPSFTNHSKTPNSDGIHAIKHIKQGEEITVDYRDDRMDKISREHFKNFI